MVWERYVAVGDSFTEGLGDPLPDGGSRGWADRVAEYLAATTPGMRYANLAIRGRRVGQIVDEQIPQAIELAPDLVTFAGGINDVLRRQWDPQALARDLHRGIGGLAATGARVVIVTYGRPSNRSRLMGVVEGRLAECRRATFEVAEHFGCDVVDFWEHRVFDDARFWSEDRLHLNAVGHERVAMAVLETLGRTASCWQEPLPAIRRPSALHRAGRHARWASRHLAPWVGRRVTGRSSGDGVTAKRPQYGPVLIDQVDGAAHRDQDRDQRDR